MCIARLGYFERKCWQGLVATEWPAHPKLSPGWSVWSLFLRFIWDKILCFYSSIFKCLWFSYVSSHVTLELLSGILTFFKEKTRDFSGTEMGEKLNGIVLIIYFLTSRTERRWTVLARQVFVAYSCKLLASVPAFSDFCSWVCILHAGKILHDTKSVRKKPRETPSCYMIFSATTFPWALPAVSWTNVYF